VGERIQAEITELYASELATQAALRRLSATRPVQAHITRIEEFGGHPEPPGLD